MKVKWDRFLRWDESGTRILRDLSKEKCMKRRETFTCRNVKAFIPLCLHLSLHVYGSHIEPSASPILLSRLLFVNVVPCTLCDFLLPTPPSPKDIMWVTALHFHLRTILLGSKLLFECLGVQWSLHNVQTSVALNWQRYNVCLLWQTVRVSICSKREASIWHLSHVCRKLADILQQYQDTTIGGTGYVVACVCILQ